jgi:hypothetical protein
MLFTYDEELNARSLKRAPCQTQKSRFQTVKFYDKKVDGISLRSNHFRY